VLLTLSAARGRVNTPLHYGREHRGTVCAVEEAMEAVVLVVVNVAGRWLDCSACRVRHSGVRHRHWEASR